MRIKGLPHLDQSLGRYNMYYGVSVRHTYFIQFCEFYSEHTCNTANSKVALASCQDSQNRINITHSA